jgi:hypothetical protein
MELDDETVEAIAAEGAPLVAGLDGMQVRALAPIFAKHLPDPRPTEAEAKRGWINDWREDLWPFLDSIGCFRPEPEPEMVTVRRWIKTIVGRKIVMRAAERRVPAGQVPEGWEVVNDD